MSFKVFFIGILLIGLILKYEISYPQVQNDAVIEQIIESIAENVSEDHDYSELTERLNFYRKNPLNINRVSKEQLQELVFISPVQIYTLLEHRTENGLFLDLLELQSLNGFDLESIHRLLNFVTIDVQNIFAEISLKNLLKKGSHDVMLRFGQIIERQPGYSRTGSSDEPAYLGSAQRIFTRYRYSYANTIAASLNMEKDAGEKFLSGSGNKGFDFYSASISIKGNGLIRKLVLGDYALQFGQGLSMWSGLGFGKGAGLTTMAKQDIGLRAYSSVNESSFLRGISGTLNFKHLLITPFFSYKKLDATLALSDVPGKEAEINTIGISGLHRTQTELNNKNSVSQLVYGANGQYSIKNLTIGLTGYHTLFSQPFAPGNLLYQRYDFGGRSLTNLGLHYNYTYKNTYFFGEAAHSLLSGSAFINGLMSSLSSQVSLVLLHRSYAKNYYSFFNQSVSEASDAVNEKGFYSGLVIKFNPKWELVTYSDFFKFPWLKFRVDAPSQGYELFAQLNYVPNKKFKVTGRYKQQVKEQNDDQLNTINELEAVEKQNSRLEISYKINNSFSLRNRAEMTRYKKGDAKPEFGFLTYQDIIYDPMSSKISGNIRFAIFDTEGFNSRIYAYENDVLYGYSVPGYQGRGLRCYLNGRYTISRGLDLWLRYAVLSYTDQQTIGSGSDKIDGNKRSDVKFQLRYQF